MDIIKKVNNTIYDIITCNIYICNDTFSLINTFDKDAQDICYTYLYNNYEINNKLYLTANKYNEFLHIFKYNLLFAKYIKKYNKSNNINYENLNIDTLIPSKYLQYPIIKDILQIESLLILHYNNTSVINNDKNNISVINNILNNKYHNDIDINLYHDYIILRFFNYTGILLPYQSSNSFLCYKLEFIRNILNCKHNLNSIFNNNYVNKFINISNFTNSDDINDDTIKLICGILFFIYVLITCNTYNIHLNFDYKNYFINNIFPFLDSKFIEYKDLITYYYKILCLNSQTDINNITLSYYNQEFYKYTNFTNFINVCHQYYISDNIKKLVKFINYNINIINNFNNWKDMKYIYAILYRAFVYILKNNKQKEYTILFYSLDTTFYNNIMYYDSLKNKYKYKFLLQRIEDDSKKLKNDEDKTICIICLEEIEGKIVYCLSCKKYIGHIDCVQKSTIIYSKCPYCNVIY